VIEGCIEGVAGWAIGKGGREGGDGSRVVDSLYSRLEQMVMPLFYQYRSIHEYSRGD